MSEYRMRNKPGIVIFNNTERGSFEVGCYSCKFAYYGVPDCWLRCAYLGGILVNGQFGCKAYKYGGRTRLSMAAYIAKIETEQLSADV